MTFSASSVPMSQTAEPSIGDLRGGFKLRNDIGTQAKMTAQKTAWRPNPAPSHTRRALCVFLAAIVIATLSGEVPAAN
jgi:hypothetical protein